MTRIIGSLPVIAAVLIAAFLPYSVLPQGVQTAFVAGGWGMRLILFAFLVSVWLVLDRSLMLLSSIMDSRVFFDGVSGRLEAGDVAGARQYSSQVNRPLARITNAGLSYSGGGAAAMQRAMDEQAYREFPQIEVRTGYLALLGNIATLMGLFGTIVGLIHSFGAVSQTATRDNATLLAAGISEAMNCTAFGLLTGILALVAYSVLNGRTQGLLDELNYYSLRIVRAWRRAARSQQASDDSAHRPLKQPHAHLMEHVGLLKARGHGQVKKSTFASLQLTPLIDMFIVMVIFLLMSFSATGEIITASKDIRLPFAQQVERLERVPVVAVSYPSDDPSGGVVTLEGAEVATARELLEDNSPDWKIAKLTEQLERMKTNWKDTHPDEAFEGKLIIQADQEIDFRILKRVMYSAGLAGYANLLFAVQKHPEEKK